MKTTLTLACVNVVLTCAEAIGADLHPIVEVQHGYLLGAIADGKSIKPDDVAKSMSDETTYHVYGLTQSLGEAKGTKPNHEEVPCDATFSVPLSETPGKSVIAVAARWNALPRKVQSLDTTQKVYVDAVRDLLKTKEIEQPQVKIDNIIRVDLDGDGEEEVLISATNYSNEDAIIPTNYWNKDEHVPIRSPAGGYSCVLLRRVVAGKVETQLVEGEFYPKAYQRKNDDDASFDAPNAYKVIAVLDLDGDGKMEIVVRSHYYEGEATMIYRCDAKKCEQLLSVGCGV
jgi:hypothetical protein